jgi:hypothetical protein
VGKGKDLVAVNAEAILLGFFPMRATAMRATRGKMGDMWPLSGPRHRENHPVGDVSAIGRRARLSLVVSCSVAPLQFFAKLAPCLAGKLRHGASLGSGTQVRRRSSLMT